MKKMYLTPALKAKEAQPAQMLAESLAIISDEKVNGNDALTKEDAAWAIWEEEE